MLNPRLQASLQIAIHDWLAKIPTIGERLSDTVEMSNGHIMTLDEVSLHMSSAAMAVLCQACAAAELELSLVR